jgi:hypothetical protein
VRTLNYAALTAPLAADDYKGPAGDPAGFSGKVSLIIGASVFTIVITIVAFVGITSYQAGYGLETLAMGLFVCMMFAAGGGGLIFAIISRRRTLARLNKFALVNGLSFRYDKTPAGYKGLIFDNGSERQVTESLLFPDGLEIGNFKYVTGSGKNRSTHTFGFARIALTRHLPNMVLDARQNNFLGMSNLPDSFHSSQRLNLEGDFNEHFDLYVPKEYERDALYVFTPDVMQALIDHGKRYDIEVVDNELFIYVPRRIDLKSQTSLEDILGVVDAIHAELKDQTKRYADERLAGVPKGTAVAEAGRRLKHGVNPFAIGLLVVYLFYNVAHNFTSHEFVGMLSFGFFVVIVVLLVGKLVTRHRL